MNRIPDPTDDPDATQADQASCEHCWHEIPLSIVMNEGKIMRYYQCCHCGKKKRKETPLYLRKTADEILAMIEEEEGKHGPHLPRGL